MIRKNTNPLSSMSPGHKKNLSDRAEKKLGRISIRIQAKDRINENSLEW